MKSILIVFALTLSYSIPSYSHKGHAHTCKEFADKFVKDHDMGDDRILHVKREIDAIGLPKYDIKGMSDQRIQTSTVRVSSANPGGDLHWKLVFTDSKENTEGEDPIVKLGAYRREYDFLVKEDGQCELEKIRIGVLPPKTQDINKRGCKRMMNAKKQFKEGGKLPTIDTSNAKICADAYAYFGKTQTQAEDPFPKLKTTDPKWPATSAQ